MHKTKALTWLIISCFILSGMLIVFNVEQVKSSGNTIWVDTVILYPEESDGSLEKPYKYIQTAIDAATDGDLIKVLPGTYGEDLVIDKSVTITNDDRQNTIIVSGSKSKYFIDITADSVSLEGFTITDSASTSHRKAVIHIAPGTTDVKLIDNLITRSGYGFGLYIEGSGDAGESHKAVINNNTFDNTLGLKIINSHSNTFYRNRISNSTGYGLLLESSKTNFIENNLIHNNANHGIYANELFDSTIKNNSIFWNDYNGVVLISSNGNEIENNTIEENAITAIELGSSDTSISYNTFNDNNIGIILASSTSNCLIENNYFYLCNSYGILAKSGSNNNKIYNNTFPGETPLQFHAKDEGSNYWNDSKFNGNYWSDYYGPDNDNNSIGDIPYILGGVYDNYPKGIFQQPPIISNPNPAHLSSGVTKNPVLQIDVVDPEGERMDINFYYLSDTGYKQINSNPINIGSGETASVAINPAYSYIGMGYDYICLWYVTAEDTYSRTSSKEILGTEYIFTTVTTPIDNEPPTADAGGPYETQMGNEIQFYGTGSNDTDGTIEFYRWSFGDGDNEINVVSPTHKYDSSGIYTVSLVIIDNHGSSSDDTTTVTVLGQENKPPVANIGGPYSGSPGKSITFDGSKSYDSDIGDSISSYTWDFGDGNTGSGPVLTHAFSSSGKYIVTLTVSDNNELNDSEIIEVNIKKSKTNDEPGFELILIICAIALVLFLKRKRIS